MIMLDIIIMLASSLKVINLRVDPVLGPGALYVGRPSPRYPKRWTSYGNPFPITEDADREEVILRHWHHVHSDPQFIAAIRRDLKDHDLACYCHPQACHAHTLLRIANSWPVVEEFRGYFEFLSNFYPSPIRSHTDDGVIIYPTAEHAYQAQKFTDIDLRKHIALLPTPGEAKREGRRHKLRKDWDAGLKDVMMARVVHAKFKQNPMLQRCLVDTRGARLIEGNWWGDTYWGQCKGKGLNKLGLRLMRERRVWCRALGINAT